MKPTTTLFRLNEKTRFHLVGPLLSRVAFDDLFIKLMLIEDRFYSILHNRHYNDELERGHFLKVQEDLEECLATIIDTHPVFARSLRLNEHFSFIRQCTAPSATYIKLPRFRTSFELFLRNRGAKRALERRRTAQQTIDRAIVHMRHCLTKHPGAVIKQVTHCLPDQPTLPEDVKTYPSSLTKRHREPFYDQGGLAWIMLLDYDLQYGAFYREIVLMKNDDADLKQLYSGFDTTTLEASTLRNTIGDVRNLVEAVVNKHHFLTFLTHQQRFINRSH